MGPWRGHTKLARYLVGCVVAAGGVIAALVVTNGHGSTATTAAHAGTLPTRTTGPWAPITVARPAVPVIGGGIPVDIDPVVARTDLSTTLSPLPGKNRYQITVSNTSNVGAINSFQWYPPTGVHIVKVLGSSDGDCTATGLTGFGGNQFRTVVLFPNILCDKLDLKPPSCTCLGDGGTMTISFVTDKDLGGSLGDARLRTATLVFDRIPGYLK
ncbi:MAG TPA: hypothetical protein VFA30_08170 [Gaiellaceae bacterium]|nr:hypothetical protein [Gaiellaceae bacterium]